MRDAGYQKDGNLLEFSKRFQDEDACRRHLFNRRWPNGFACPRCGGVEYYHISTRDLYECRYCRHQASIRPPDNQLARIGALCRRRRDHDPYGIPKKQRTRTSRQDNIIG
jgi:predicted RNA-binding Zn-ribbon protein involved in translation (DUF1610 family)